MLTIVEGAMSHAPTTAMIAPPLYAVKAPAHTLPRTTRLVVMMRTPVRPTMYVMELAVVLVLKCIATTASLVPLATVLMAAAFTLPKTPSAART